MWNYEMTSEEVNSQTCGTEGNIASWSTLQEQGVSTRTHDLFPDCVGKQIYFALEEILCCMSCVMFSDILGNQLLL
jgi:hypothetical protein